MAKKKVLIADDDLIFLLIAAKAMSSIGGVSVDAVSDGASAWSLGSSLSVPYDAAVLDIEMPIFSGVSVLSVLEHTMKENSVIVVTGHEFSSKDIEVSLKDSILMHRCVHSIQEKPIETEVLKEYIMQIIEE